MTSIFNYTNSGDFSGNFDMFTFISDINDSSIIPSFGMESIGNDITVRFSSNLTSGEETTLNNIVTGFVANPISSNTIRASELGTTGASVVVANADPPTTGQVLTATGATGANWQTPSGGSITSFFASSTANTTTTSTTYVLMDSMTLIPGAGTYMVTFSSSGIIATTNTILNYAVFNNGTIVQDSERDIGSGGGPTNGMEYTLSTQTITTVSAGQAIEIRWVTGTGSITAYERNLILIQLS